MAGNNDQVKYTDLFDSDITSGLNALKTALEEVVKQITALKAEAQALKKALGNANTATCEQQQTTAADAAEAERLSRQIKELTTEEARLKSAIAEANRMTKLQGQAANAAEGSLNQMRARYKLLVAEMSNYNLKTAEGQRKMKATAAEARKLRDEIYKLEASYGQFGRNVGNYTGALSRFGARLKEAAARFVAFNAAFLSATGLIRFGKALFEVRKELESTLVTYKALAGEIQGAKLFEEVKNFALTTPVTLNAASKAVQTMLSFGVAQEKVVDIMKRLGDISSADSERMQRLALAYSQATQAGRLMGQDTLQFINAGFNPLYYISLRTGESMENLRDQMKKGKIDISQVTQAIIDATSEGGQFNGMLEKQRDTMKGAAAIMEGAWQNMLNEMGQDMESGIVGIIKWLTGLMQNWRKTIKTLKEVAISIGTAKAVMLLYKAAVDASARSVAAETAAMNANSAAAAANATATANATTAKKGWLSITNLLTGAVRGLGGALKSFLPFAVISTVTFFVTKLIDARRETKMLTNYTEDLANAAAEARTGARNEYMMLDKLFGELKKAKEGTEDFLTAKQNIIDNFSQYDDKLQQELTDVTNLDTAYQNLKIAIENSYNARARESFMDASNQRLSKAAVNIEALRNNILAQSTEKNGRWKPEAMRGSNMRVPGGTTIPIPSDKEIFDALEQLLNAKDIEGLQKNRLYQMMNQGYNIDADVKNYIQSLRAWIEAQNKANAMWGEYQPRQENGYTPVTTGGADGGAGGKVHEQKVNDKQWEAIRARLRIEQEGYKLEQSLLKVDRDEKLANLKAWQTEQHAALKQNLDNNLITEEEYNKKIAEIDDQYKDVKAGIEDDYWKAVRTLRSKNMKERSEEWEKNAKDNAKRELKAMADGWQEQRAALVEQGATRRKLIEEEVAAEIARLNLMLKLNRDVNGEIMSDEQKAKVQEWINLLEQLQQTGNYAGVKPGQIAGKGGANVGTAKAHTWSNIIDVLTVDHYGENRSWTKSLFGDMDTEEINKWKSGVQEAFNQAKEALQSWMDARKEAAAQAKEEADDAVSAAENALNREIELRNQGYANNVALKEKELADAKAMQQRAIEQQRQAEKEQLAIDTAMQASSIVTAIANIIKEWSKLGIAGQVASVGAILTMLGTFAWARVKAFQTVNTKQYRDGGVMLLEGGSHESGHDVNLGIGPDGSNLRAEGGEYFAVINKRSSRKYGSQIPAVVNALNSGMFEDRYIKTSDAVGLLPQVIRADNGSYVDLSKVEGGVDALVKQGESRWSTEGEYRVMRYKNLTRRVRIS